MKKKKSIIVWAVIIIAVIVCLAFIVFSRDKGEQLTVETTTVSRGDFF